MGIKQVKESRFIRFLLGGAVTVFLEYSIFYVLYIFWGWHLLLANSLSFCVALATSFLFNRLWAFNEDSFRMKTHHQIILFTLLALTNLLINNAIVSGLQIVGVDPRAGKVVAIIFIAIWNFIAYRKIIFVGHKSDIMGK